MATMLQLVQQAMSEMGLTAPTYVANNASLDVVQTLALMNAVGYELQRQHQWQALCTEYQFTVAYLETTGDVTEGSAVVTNIPSTTGLSSAYLAAGTGINSNTGILTVDNSTQVTLNQVATASGTGVALTFGKTKYAMPSDFDRQIDRTHYDKSKKWEMLGPETPQQWEFLKSSYISTGPRIRYRIMGGFFQIWPLTSSSEILGFEYVSSKWARDNSGVAKSSLTVDTDTCVFPDRLMVLGTKLKYFETKGFDTAAFYRDYTRELDISKANDAGSATLSFAPRLADVLVNWNNIPDTGYGPQ